MLTHKMLADKNLPDYGRQTLANSISPSSKHFFPCTESGTITAITDSISSVEIGEASSGVTLTEGATSGLQVRALSWNASEANVILTSGTWTQPGSNDCIVLICGKSRINGAGEPSEGGFISAYIGSQTSGQLKVQPYYASFIDTSAGGTDRFSTPVYSSLLTREDGEDYIFAAVKRGDILEHYASDVLTGTRDISTQQAALASSFSAFNPDPYFYTGHSAYASDIFLCSTANKVVQNDAACDNSAPYYKRSNGDSELTSYFWPLDGNSSSTSEYAQDLYGLGFWNFSNGAPSQTSIKRGLAWMKTEWVSGNKVLYPGWVSYT